MRQLQHPPEPCRLGGGCVIDSAKGARKTCVPCRYEKCTKIVMKKSGEYISINIIDVVFNK